MDYSRLFPETGKMARIPELSMLFLIESSTLTALVCFLRLPQGIFEGCLGNSTSNFIYFDDSSSFPSYANFPYTYYTRLHDDHKPGGPRYLGMILSPDQSKGRYTSTIQISRSQISSRMTKRYELYPNFLVMTLAP